MLLIKLSNNMKNQLRHENAAYRSVINGQSHDVFLKWSREYDVWTQDF